MACAFKGICSLTGPIATACRVTGRWGLLDRCTFLSPPDISAAPLLAGQILRHCFFSFLALFSGGDRLTGTGGPDAVERYPIANGQVTGERITFELTTGDWKFFYDLKDSGLIMRGKLTLKSVNSTRTAEVTLKKSP